MTDFINDQVVDEGGQVDEPQAGQGTEPDDGGQPAQPQEPDPQPQQQQQQNYAFAQLRTENTKYKSFVDKIVSQLGLDANISLDDLNRQLEEASAAKLAQQHGIDQELAKKIAAIESSQNAIANREKISAAQAVLRDVQAEFGESDEGMKAFLSDLESRGIDAYSANLRNEYLATNLDKIIEKSVEAALQRQNDTNRAPSGSPGASVATGGGAEGKINSVAELSKIFDEMKV